MHKELKKLIREAERNGAVVVNGHKHIKLYDQDGNLVCVLAFGSQRDRVPGGFRSQRKALRAHGLL